MQKAFGTSLAHYDSPLGRYRGRTGSIMLPAELQGVVTAVLGLDNRPIAKPHLRMARAAAAAAGLSPALVAQLYNFPARATGAGQTIGTIALPAEYAHTTLIAYFTRHHLTT